MSNSRLKQRVATLERTAGAGRKAFVFNHGTDDPAKRMAEARAQVGRSGTVNVVTIGASRQAQSVKEAEEIVTRYRDTHPWGSIVVTHVETGVTLAEFSYTAEHCIGDEDESARAR